MRHITDSYGPRLWLTLAWAHYVARPVRSWLCNTAELLMAGSERRGVAREHMALYGLMIRLYSVGWQTPAKVATKILPILFAQWRHTENLMNYRQSVLVMMMQHGERSEIEGDCVDAAALACWCFRTAGQDAQIVYLYGDTKAHAVCLTPDYITCNDRVIDRAATVASAGDLGSVFFELLGETVRYTWPRYSKLTGK
jgi:hypothetical protein